MTIFHEMERIRTYPDEKPEEMQTVFCCNHFYDHWWFAHYENGYFCISDRCGCNDSFERLDIITKWIPISRPCFMFDQDEGSLEDFQCPKCFREYVDCKAWKCTQDIDPKDQD